MAILNSHKAKGNYLRLWNKSFQKEVYRYIEIFQVFKNSVAGGREMGVVQMVFFLTPTRSMFPVVLWKYIFYDAECVEFVK